MHDPSVPTAKAVGEALARLTERVTTADQRIDELDERVTGSTAWLVHQARTVTLMTSNEGMELLRWAVDQYDGKHGLR